MNNSLDTLFTGHLYIDKSYGAGLLPSLISMYMGKPIAEKTETEKVDGISKVYINVNSPAANIDSALNENTSKVVVLDFKQPVVKYSTYYWLGTQTYIAILERLKSDPTVVGVVIDADTGGGQVYGTPEMYDVVKSFAEVKTIGFFTNGYLCSGGYYIAAPASFIMANKRADAIGSIGAYTNMVNYDGLLEKFGAKVHTIYSDLSPDKNKNYRAVMDGTDPDYKQYIKEELNPMVITFHDDMRSVRPQLKEVVFKGGTWTGAQAIEMGLVDLNGSLQDAISKVFELAESNKNSNKNPKKTSMSKIKSYPNLQKTMGIEADGLKVVKKVVSGKVGVFIEEAQLDALEQAAAGVEADKTALEKKVSDAEAAKTAAEGKVTTIETEVNAAVTAAKLTAEATPEANIKMLGEKVVEYGKKPGARINSPKSEGDSFEEGDGIVKATDSHNEYYNKA